MKTAEKEIFRKTYGTDDTRDKTKPIGTWFSNSPEGLVLFIVFYTKACIWNKCLGCNLPSLSATGTVDFRALMTQIDFVYQKQEILRERNNVRQIIVSNNGSVLDQRTFSSTALIYFVAKTNMIIPNLSVLTLETRTEYVDTEELELLARALREGETPTTLEIAVGIEAYDDHIRNKVFKKGLLLNRIEQLAEKLAQYNFRLKCYLMQKPVPEMTDEEAVEDVKNAIDYLDKLAARYGIKVNMHLNPTYVAKGTALEEAFKNNKYWPPYPHDVARAMSFAKGKSLSVCIGLNDEGLAVPGGSFLRDDDSKIAELFNAFNATQNFELLERI